MKNSICVKLVDKKGQQQHKKVLDLLNVVQSFVLSEEDGVHINAVLIRNNYMKEYYIERLEGDYTTHTDIIKYNTRTGEWNCNISIPDVFIKEVKEPFLTINNEKLNVCHRVNVTKKYNGGMLRINVLPELLGDVLVKETISDNNNHTSTSNTYLWNSVSEDWVEFNTYNKTKMESPVKLVCG